MKLPFFSKKETDNSKFLAATINTDAVRCLTFYQTGKELKIIGAYKQPLDPSKVRAGNIVAPDEVAEALETAVLNATENTEYKPSDVILGVSGDLCLGLMTTIRAKRAKAVPVSKNEMDELFAKISESSQIQAQNEILQITARTDIELVNITSSNVFLKLDGQKTSELVNKTGYVVEAAVFNAYVPSYHLQTLDTIAKNAGLKISAIGSGMYCLTQAIIKSNPDLSDFIVIEIDGDYTSIGVVFGKGIVTTRTLNVGYRSFVEGISERMGLTLTEADRILKSYASGKLMPSESTIVQNALRGTLEIWLNGMQLLFQEFTGVKTFATKIFITGEGTAIPDLWTMLTTSHWTKTIPFKAEPEFNRLGFMDVKNITDSTGQVSSAEWLPTAVLGQIHLELYGGEDD